MLKNDTFVYDVTANEWSKVVTDGRIYGHDAHSVFAYDESSDAFLLAFAPEGRGKQLKLAAFSLADKKWKLVEPRGTGMIPPVKYGSYHGYFDPLHGVFVVQGRYSDRLWIYRPESRWRPSFCRPGLSLKPGSSISANWRLSSAREFGIMIARPDLRIPNSITAP